MYSKRLWWYGFRVLRAFNLALLAKQGWWLQQNSNSLFYQVFKNKYFPDTSFVNAQKGTQSTYQVISPRTLLPKNVKADFLINADHGCWRADLVKGTVY